MISSVRLVLFFFAAGFASGNDEALEKELGWHWVTHEDHLSLEFSGADKVEAAEGMEWTEQESEWKPVSLLLLFSRDS